MAGEFVEFFTELLFGSGNWVGLIIICLLLFMIGALNKYGGLIGMPIAVLLGIEYASRDLGWHAVLLILEGIFVLYLSVKEMKKK